MSGVAIVRDLPDSFSHALAGDVPGGASRPLDVARARRQHAAYVAALRAAGLDVRALPADEACPDCCFVEDTAVIAEGVAVVTRPGAPTRRPEVAPIADALLALGLRVERMPAPATLDGGDVLRVGRRLIVGRSARTNDAGAAFLEGVLGPLGYDVVRAGAEGALHLKCHASLAGPGLVLAAERWLEARLLPPGAQLVTVPEADAFAANVVALPTVAPSALVHTGYPAVEAALRAMGVRPVPVDLSELALADGSLTCCSLVIGDADRPRNGRHELPG